MDTLSKTDEFYPYVKQIIKKQAITFQDDSDTSLPSANKHRKVQIHDLSCFPYRAKDHVFPERSKMIRDALYLLLSQSPKCRQYGICKVYIGETINIRRRLHQHHAGCDHGSDPIYKPYIPLIYFTGFESNHQ